MQLRSLAFRTDLALLALGGSQIEDRGDHLVVRTEANPHFYWGNFYLLGEPPSADAVPDLLARYDAEFRGRKHRAFGIDGTADQSADLKPLVAAGLEEHPGAVMTATSVHEPPHPNTEATYRPLVSDDDWAQRVGVSWACNSEYPRDEFFEFATRKGAYERSLVEAGHGAWWGAFLGDRLVSGMGLFAAGEGLARFQSVETHPDLRGRGLAGTLVHRVSRYGYEDLGAHTLVMVADPGYHAIRIYRSVGFAETEHQTQLQQLSRSA